LTADNDGIYGKWLEEAFKKYFEIEVFRIPYNKPWKNGRIERYFRTIKDEIFRGLNVEDDFHARRLCTVYQQYYNEYRPHQSISGKTPSKSVQQQFIGLPFKMQNVRKIKAANGLISRYELAA
jgi:hypothetical protein